MKILNQILLVSFIVLVLFILRNDIRLTYNKILHNLEDQIISSDRPLNNNEAQRAVLLKDPITNTKLELIEAPGALRVVDKIQTSLTKSLKNYTLSGQNIITETNLSRKDNGNLPALKENSKLNFSAEKKLQDMLAKQYFDHVSPSGVSINELGTQVGYQYILIGENLALGNFDSDKALVEAWMASPGHRQNILNKNFREIGVAVGQGQYEGRNIWMAVQHFGLPQSTCPAIDQVLFGMINLNEKEIDQMTAEMVLRRERINKGGVYEGLTTNELINQYNNFVSDYNKLISKTKELINKYNQQVKDFNSCIESNT